jgi:hypothetical protein
MKKYLNLPAIVAEHLVGSQHKEHHRMLSGLAIMGVGVSIAKSGHYFHTDVIIYLVDLVGYGVHGIGLVPFVEHILEKEHEKDNKEN